MRQEVNYTWQVKLMKLRLKGIQILLSSLHHFEVLPGSEGNLPKANKAVHLKSPDTTDGGWRQHVMSKKKYFEKCPIE